MLQNQFSRRTFDDLSVVLVGVEPSGTLDRNARRMCEECVRAGLDTFRVDYDDLETIPALTSRDEVLVMIFFPHRFWDAHCETPDDTELYGTSWESFRRFRDFCQDIEARLERILAGRRVVYLIPPGKAFADRDKIATIERLVAAGVLTPQCLNKRNAAEILEQVEPGRGIFIKCRFGSEGKGISFLSHEGWWTNYRVEDGRLGNYGVREPWRFTEITGKTEFLGQLLAQEMIVEKEIVSPQIGPETTPDTKFDIRAYVSAGVSPHMFLRINRRDALITNYSQGATVEHLYEEVLPEEAIFRVRQAALRAAQTLECPFVGVDLMFDRDGFPAVVETQVFTDYPDYRFFNLPAFLVRQIRAGLWSASIGTQREPVAEKKM